MNYQAPDELVADPSLEKVLEKAIDNALMQVNVCLPAQVVSYDTATNSCTAQPALQRRYADNTVVNLPQIHGVPVAWPRSGNAFLSFPLSAGDYVLLIFSQRSLELWLNQGGIVDPNDPRKFSLSDAVAYPGCYPYGKAAPVDSANVVLQNGLSSGAAKVSLLPTGRLRIEQTGGDELLDLVSQICQALTQSLVNTMLGAQPLINASTFATLQTRINAIKG